MHETAPLRALSFDPADVWACVASAGPLIADEDAPDVRRWAAEYAEQALLVGG